MNTTAVANQAVKKVNSYFEYKTDGKFDKWTFTSPGDCENYALLVLKEITGSQDRAVKALLNKDAYIWFVKTTKGQGHAVLEYEGRFVDSRFRRWVDDLDKLDVRPERSRYARLFLVGKLGVGSLFGF